MLKNKKQLQLLEPHHWLLDSQDLNPADFMIWELFVPNIYRGERTTNLDSLNPLLITGIKFCKKSLRFQRGTEVEGWHIEMIINNSHRYFSRHICKIWYNFHQLKKRYYNLNQWVLFLPTLVL